MLAIAFIVLAVLGVLFGSCVFVYVKGSRSGGEDLYEESPKRKTAEAAPPEPQPEEKEDAPAQSVATPSEEAAQQTRRIVIPQREAAPAADEAEPNEGAEENKEAEEAKEEKPQEETRLATDAEALRLKKAALETAERKAAGGEDAEHSEESDEAALKEENEGKSPNLTPIIAVLIAALVILCAVAGIMVKRAFDKNRAQLVNAPETITATVSNIRQQAQFSGSVESENPEIAVFAAGGKIEELKVKEGDYVSKGDVIYVLDSSNLEERIELLNQRMQTLTVTEEKTVDEDTDITAYSNGTITKIYASVGDKVTERTPVAEVTETGEATVTLSFNRDDVGEVGSSSTIKVYSGSKEYEGTFVGAKENAQQGTVDVTISFSAEALLQSSRVTAQIDGVSGLGSGAAKAGSGATAVVFANASGTLSGVRVKVGDSIKSGDTIATVTVKKEVTETKDDELAQKELKLQIEQLESELQNYTVTAPVDGFVKKLYMKIGDNAAVNMQAVSIVPDGGLYLKVSIDSKEAENITVPAAAEFKIIKTSGFSSDVWEKLDTSVTYSAIMSELALDEENSGKYVGYISLENQSAFREGMTAQVNVVTYSKYDAILLPQELVTDGKVKIWQANKIEEVEVETGIITDDGYVEIISGINSVDKVVVNDAQAQNE